MSNSFKFWLLVNIYGTVSGLTFGIAVSLIVERRLPVIPYVFFLVLPMLTGMALCFVVLIYRK